MNQWVEDKKEKGQFKTAIHSHAHSIFIYLEYIYKDMIQLFQSKQKKLSKKTPRN